MEKIIYTVAEVADLLRVNKTFVYDIIKRGELRAVKIGSIKVYFRDLENYIINCKEVS